MQAHTYEPSRFWELLHSDSHKYLMSAVPDDDRGRSVSPSRNKYRKKWGQRSAPRSGAHQRSSSAPPSMRLSDLLIESTAAPAVIRQQSIHHPAATGVTKRWATKSLAEFISAVQAQENNPSVFPSEPAHRKNSMKRQIMKAGSFSISDPPYAIN